MKRDDLRPATFADYELEKQDWLFRNPDHTPEQYQAACREIAERLGL